MPGDGLGPGPGVGPGVGVGAGAAVVWNDRMIEYVLSWPGSKAFARQ